MRDGDVARLERLQDMAEAFCGWLHAKGAEEIEKGGDGSVETVRQLSTSFNKAARAVRLAMVLKHEVAGLRPVPNARTPASVGQDAAAEAGGRRPGAPRRFYRDYGDYTDEEETDDDRTEEELAAYLTPLVEALETDLAAAPPEIQARAKGESIAVKLTTVAAAIPHPALDRALADTQLGAIWDILAPKYASRPESLGPPCK